MKEINQLIYAFQIIAILMLVIYFMSLIYLMFFVANNEMQLNKWKKKSKIIRRSNVGLIFWFALVNVIAIIATILLAIFVFDLFLINYYSLEQIVAIKVFGSISVIFTFLVIATYFLLINSLMFYQDEKKEFTKLFSLKIISTKDLIWSKTLNIGVLSYEEKKYLCSIHLYQWMIASI